MQYSDRDLILGYIISINKFINIQKSWKNLQFSINTFINFGQYLVYSWNRLSASNRFAILFLSNKYGLIYFCLASVSFFYFLCKCCII